MKKIFLLVLFLSQCAVGFTTDSLIYWNPFRKLVFADFTQMIDSNSSNRAVSFIRLSCEYKADSDSNLFRYQIKVYFDTQKSWIKSSDPFVLKHEQIHFNIGELYARKLRKSLSYLRFNFVIDEQFTKIVNEINKEMADAQKLFDKETNYLVDYSIQDNWDTTITNELKNLKEYESADWYKK